MATLSHASSTSRFVLYSPAGSDQDGHAGGSRRGCAAWAASTSSANPSPGNPSSVRRSATLRQVTGSPTGDSTAMGSPARSIVSRSPLKRTRSNVSVRCCASSFSVIVSSITLALLTVILPRLTGRLGAGTLRTGRVAGRCQGDGGNGASGLLTGRKHAPGGWSGLGGPA